MPFEIVRNDIVNMQVDAIVNTANPKPIVGYGVDAGVHKKAGPQLLAAREQVGRIDVGEVAVTPGFGLDAKHVIHAVGPIWQDGKHGEEQLLRQCYDRALYAAFENDCESIAFPLLSAGNHGFPKPLALQIAISAFSSFLMEHDMQIYTEWLTKRKNALYDRDEIVAFIRSTNETVSPLLNGSDDELATVYAGFEMTPISWDPRYKGIDDLLNAAKKKRSQEEQHE